MRPEICPICGADVPVRAKACPQCGADEQTGWAEDAYASSLNLPDEDAFNYDQFVQREFSRREVRPHGIRWFWWVIAIVIVIVFVAGVLRWH